MYRVNEHDHQSNGPQHDTRFILSRNQYVNRNSFGMCSSDPTTMNKYERESIPEAYVPAAAITTTVTVVNTLIITVVRVLVTALVAELATRPPP